MSNILEEIKSNSIETLHLSESYDHYFDKPQDFVDAMKVNTSIKHVIFDKDFLGCSVARDRKVIGMFVCLLYCYRQCYQPRLLLTNVFTCCVTVSSLGDLPNLETVTLADSLVMVGVCVTNLVKNSKSVKEITLQSCLLQGVPDDFELFRSALASNDSVQAIHLTKCSVPNEDVNFDGVVTDLKSGSVAIDVA